MICQYDDELLEKWDGVCKPVGSYCFECEEFDCEHNCNGDNPNFPDDEGVRSES